MSFEREHLMAKVEDDKDHKQLVLVSETIQNKIQKI